MGASVSTVKVDSNVDKEWYWLTGDCNPTDFGMRTDTKPEDLAVGAHY